MMRLFFDAPKGGGALSVACWKATLWNKNYKSVGCREVGMIRNNKSSLIIKIIDNQDKKSTFM